MVNFGLLAAESIPCKFQQVSRLGSVMAWASAKLCGVKQRAPTMFGRATITLGIGSHSSITFRNAAASLCPVFVCHYYRTTLCTQAQRMLSSVLLSVRYTDAL